MSSEELVIEILKAKQNGISQSDLARNLGWSRQRVHNRIKALRKAGVKLPELPVGNGTRGGRIDAVTLNALIAEIEPEL